MSGATPLEFSPRTRGPQSRRLLRLAGDDRLVEQIRRGSEAAFEVAFERHAPAILGYCRHMLGSPEEAEDAVQHTFTAAYGDLRRDGEREIALRPWLFTIARNRCLSRLRARREVAVEEPEVVTAGVAEQVERRAELRQLLADVGELPEEQRDALLLAEVGDLPQADIARVLGCEVSRVKGLVYRARSALIARRDARELPCREVREQLATLRGGSLRRAALRLHVRECPGCRAFREDVRRQRQMLSLVLPVAPTLGLKSSVLAAVGAGGAAGGGGAAAAGLLGGGSVAAKLAVAGALAVGGGSAVVVAERDAGPAGRGGAAAEVAPDAGAASAPATDRVWRPIPSNEGRERQTPQRVAKGHGRAGAPAAPGRGRGRGPIATPPRDTPVRRGPPEGRGRPEQAGRAPEAKGNSGAQSTAKGPPKGKPERPAAAPQAERGAPPEAPGPRQPGPRAPAGRGR